MAYPLSLAIAVLASISAAQVAAAQQRDGPPSEQTTPAAEPTPLPLKLKAPRLRMLALADDAAPERAPWNIQPASSDPKQPSEAPPSLADAQQPAANDPAALAKKLSNPVASLISVPFQFNYDSSIGPDEGQRATLNIQPVIPFSIAKDWNVISRTILPIIDQEDILPNGGGDEFGLGDITQSFFFTPKEPTKRGIIWGVGPVALIPTATEDLLGTGKLGLGPTGLILTQKGHWTVGCLANHIWSVAGDDDRRDVNSTFLQPFVSYTTPDAWTFTLNTESSYDWEGEEWSVPFNGVVSKLTTFRGQPVSIGAGVRYWADAPDSGPEGFGFRIQFTLLFPK